MENDKWNEVGNNKRDRAREQEPIMQKWGENPVIDVKNEETETGGGTDGNGKAGKAVEKSAFCARTVRDRENEFAQSGAKWRDDALKYCENDGI